MLALLAGGVGVASWAVPPAILKVLHDTVHTDFSYLPGSKIYDAWISDLSAEAPDVHFYM